MKFKGIRVKIFRSMIIVVILPLSITSAIIAYQISRDMKEDIQFAKTRTEQGMKDTMEQYFQSLYETAYQIYSNPDLIQSLTNNTAYLPNESRTYDNVRDIKEFFLSVYNNSRVKDIVGMYLINVDDEAVGNFFPSLYPRLTSEYIQNLLLESKESEGEPTILLNYNSMYSEPVIQYLYPVNSMGKRTGLLVIDMRESYFRELIEKYNDFYNGSIALTNQSGEIAYHTDFTKVGSIYSAEELQGDPIILEVPLGTEGWTLHYNFYADPEVILFRNGVIGVLILSGVLVLVFSYSLSYSMTKPIVSMYRKMGRIQIGDYSVRIDTVTNDEIGYLGKQFNKMVDTIQQLIDHELKLQLTNQESQIKALQAQISPHFLFNTLQTMSSIAQVNDVPDLKLICQSLSNMYRYNMNIRNEWVQVKDELMHIRNYMVIINKRYPESIRIRFQMDSSTRNLSIPKLILQPIVENSVEHGLIPLLQGKKLLKIFAKVNREDGILYLYVLDNGVGLTTEQLENVQFSLGRENLFERANSSIGLHNVHSRIQLICGVLYGIRVYSKNGKGTCIELSLPLKEVSP
ncbi:cache domain-containing sensor histidine kinase [Paenibacillus anaericanus]|uniref:cache domain-containing sensor histidine kinase n=1 Tax=Paenibacillus anaericanus TaxID=170367 RepID=UPI0027D8557C|nr:sensor histidine kinase [Paenibacillus anaericanus]